MARTSPQFMHFACIKTFYHIAKAVDKHEHMLYNIRYRYCK